MLRMAVEPRGSVGAACMSVQVAFLQRLHGAPHKLARNALAAK